MRALTVLLALVATPFLAGVSQSPQGLKCDNGRSGEHRSAQGTANAHKGVCKPADPPPPTTQVLDSDQDGVPDSLDACPSTALGTTVDASGCPVQSSPPPVLDADQDGVPDSLDACPNTALGTAVDASGCPLPSTPPPPLPPPPTTSGGGCVSSGSAGGTASIDGQVYVDASPSYPGLAGWCVQVTGPVTATAVTDSYGNYWFPGLPAGTYTVCETVQAGWHETFPTSGPACATGFGWTITVKDGFGASYIWFGNLTP